MSKAMRPFFVTGARAKIKLAGKTLAYCTDISYTVDVNHAVPRVLGMYEGVSVEPISYLVNGNLSIVRYIRGAKGLTSSVSTAVTAQTNKNVPIAYEYTLIDGAPGGTVEDGNGVGNMGPDAPVKSQGIFGAFKGVELFGGSNGLNRPRPHESFDPATFEAGNTFDIEVFQTFTDIKGKDGEKSTSVSYEDSKNNGVVRIREARFTRLEGQISKRSVLIERYSFTALYLDGDSFLARPSGTYGVGGERFNKGETGT